MPGVILAYLDQPVDGTNIAACRGAPGGSGLAAREVHALIVRTPPEATIMPTEEVLPAATSRPHPRAGESACGCVDQRIILGHGAV